MGYLSVRTFSMLAAHLDGRMNWGAVTLLSEVQHRCQGEGIKAGGVMVWAYPYGQNRLFHKR